MAGVPVLGGLGDRAAPGGRYAHGMDALGFYRVPGPLWAPVHFDTGERISRRDAFLALAARDARAVSPVLCRVVSCGSGRNPDSAKKIKKNKFRKLLRLT